MKNRLTEMARECGARVPDGPFGGTVEFSVPQMDAFARAVIAAHEAASSEKRAPVQGLTGGIPWSLHLEAYDVYRKKYGSQEALIDLEGRGCRGGFGTRELDDFIPGWRERASELTALKAEIAAIKAQNAALLADLTQAAETLRRYETLHRAKGTADSTEKAEVNAALAARFEATIAQAVQP